MTLYYLFTLLFLAVMALEALLNVLEQFQRKLKSKRRSRDKD